MVVLLLVFAVAGVVAGYLLRGRRGKKDTAAVKISSVPGGARIFLDGKDAKRRTPATIQDLKSGKHAVWLTKAGFVDWKTTVALEAGKTASVAAVLVRATADETEEPAETQPPADTTPPPTPQQLTTKVTGYDVTLEWSAVSDPSGVNYSVEIERQTYTNGAYGWGLSRTVTVSSTSYYLGCGAWPSAVLSPAGEAEYFARCRVWATDGAGNQSQKTDWLDVGPIRP